MINESKLRITNKYFFKCSEKNLPDSMIAAISDIESALSDVRIDSYKKSREKTKGSLFSPVDLNEKIKKILNAKGMVSKRIACNYSSIDNSLQANVDLIISFFQEISRIKFISKNKFKEMYAIFANGMSSSSLGILSWNKSWERLTKGYDSHDDHIYHPLLIKVGKNYGFINGVDIDNSVVPYFVGDFVGFREIDFIYNHESTGEKVGIEVQFGKYAFMVYNVCAKMKIFEKSGLINYGVEVVPSKKMQKFMSTGVSFFEQFVWDLQNRGAFSEDVPVVVLAIEPNEEGFNLLKTNNLTEVSISRSV